MADAYPPSKLQIPQSSPFNVQAVKQYVFNETGNIMLASTAIASDTIEQQVRDIFAEVSVFFAAMTKAISTSFNPTTKEPYSLYDYVAIQNIIDGSGLFVHVTEEDITHTSNSWGVDLSKELVEGLLGLATGVGELSFAQAMVASMGQEGLKIGGSDSHTDSRVANIVFVCEYLLGMPIVSAIVVYVDAQKNYQQFKAGPCVTESSTSFSMTMHKDTYMFVTPNFVKNYSGDLLSVETDLQFAEFVSYLGDLVARKPIITAVETLDGQPAPEELVVGTQYVLVGTFLDGPQPPAANGPVLKFVQPDPQTKVTGKVTGQIQADFVSFGVSGEQTTPVAIGLFADDAATEPYVTTAGVYSTSTAALSRPSPLPQKDERRAASTESGSPDRESAEVND